jgi:hypothetical protein
MSTIKSKSKMSFHFYISKTQIQFFWRLGLGFFEFLKKQWGCVTLWPCHLHENISYCKRRIMETQIFHHAKKNKPNLQKQKNPLKKKNQNPSRYYNSIPNLKFQQKPKYHLLKILR